MAREPARFIGMIGVSPEGGSSRVHVVAGAISPEFIVAFSQAHEAAGFDTVLVGYYSSAADDLAVAQHAAAHTSTLRYLIAHRPGFVAPTLAARKFATLDQLCGGRVSVHIITGVSDREQASDGDFLGKDDRYRRSSEYIDLLRQSWTATEPFDYRGDFYQVDGGISHVKSPQTPHPPIFFGGSSPTASQVGGAKADVYALFGEPREAISRRMGELRQISLAAGRDLRFSVSFRPIIAETEAAA